MSDKWVLEETIGEDGKLVLQLPPDAPRGQVRITIEPAGEPASPELTPEEEAALDAELEELLSPENLRGLGLTAEEIARSPEFGAWAHRDDIIDGETYVEKMRSKRRYTW